MRHIAATHRINRGALLAALLTVALATTTWAAAPAAGSRSAGIIDLQVDASDVERRILRVTETIPARPGKLVLHYPQWLPGNHAPRGTIDQVAGLRFRANGQEMAWQRDPLDVYRFTVDVPAGVKDVQAEFQVATPQASDQGRIVMSANLLNLQWNQVVLYPAGAKVNDLAVRATLRLPAGWQHASALRIDPARRAAAGDQHAFAAVPLEVLVDSPLFAGRYFRAVDLTPAGSPPVMLNIVADEAADLAATDAQICIHRALVREAYAALGPPRYDHYDFLLALTENIGGVGLEHHRSSENSQVPAHFRSWDEDIDSRDLLAHEFTHSWNGKYRRPARLWTPHFNTPMQDDLLWVYEGMTQYYGMVLAARSGLWPQDFARETWAAVAAAFDRKRPGRQWRSLADTTHQPIISSRRPQPWPSWQRAEDYYSESAMLWLDVDTKLRELTKGERSLDDFARSFFAAPASQGWVATYEFADVVRALNAVAPLDWSAFLKARVEGMAQPVLEGVERAGFRLVYNDQPNKAISDIEKSARRTDHSYSLGLIVGRDNVLSEVVWDGPAFKAGLTGNTTLIAVNGKAYSADALKNAIKAAASGGPLVELIVRNQDRFRTVQIDYRGGLRYPHLEAVAERADALSPVLAPRTVAP
jgi:predicted metalloprotease with PDZ domain